MKNKINFKIALISLMVGTSFLPAYGSNSVEGNNYIQNNNYSYNFRVIVKNINNYSDSELSNIVNNINQDNGGINIVKVGQLNGNYISYGVSSNIGSSEQNSFSNIRNVMENYGLSNSSGIDMDLVLSPLSFRDEPDFSKQLYMLSQSNLSGSSGIAAVKDEIVMPPLPNTGNSALDDNIYASRPTIAFLDTGINGHQDFFGNNIVGQYKFSRVFVGDTRYLNYNAPDHSQPDFNISDNLYDLAGRGNVVLDLADYTYYEEIPSGDPDIPPTIVRYQVENCISGHGLGMASLATAPVRGEGIAGVADANILIAKTMDSRCDEDAFGVPQIKTVGLLSDVADAIRWSVMTSDDNGSGIGVDLNLHAPDYTADIINLSLGGAYNQHCPDYLQDAINFAYGRGAIIVVAAGNNSDRGSDTLVPANCDNVLTITSNGGSGDLSSFASSGFNVDFSMMGETFPVPIIEVNSGVVSRDSYGEPFTSSEVRGTSLSAALFSGSAALLKYPFPNLDKNTLKKALSSKDPVDVVDCDGNGIPNAGFCGNGVADIEFAYNYLLEKTNYDRIISNYFAADLSCPESIKSDAFADLGIDVCQLYYVEINNPNELEGYSYEILSKPKSNSKWIYATDLDNNNKNNVNATVLSEVFVGSDDIGSSKRVLVQGVDPSQFDYAIRICDETDFCHVPYDIEFKIDPDALPAFCR